MSKTTNVGLTKPDSSDYVSIDVINENMDIIDENLGKSNAHTVDKTNPHNITKAQVGLGNVPNVATNNQTPTYTVATVLAALVSGEVLSTAMGKIAKAITDLISHLANKSNPHGVTASQVGASPTSHASTTTTYGIGTGSNYGHVKLSDSTGSASGASAGIAATPAAVKAAYELADTANTKAGGAAEGLTSHTNNTSNPHNVTKAQLNLGKVDNTADAEKTVKSASTCTGNAATATKFETARTIQIALDSTEAASFDGTQNVTLGVSGILPVANGGTGASTLASGAVLIGNGTGAVQTRAITNNTSKGTAEANTNIVTANTLVYHSQMRMNRTTNVHAADTSYTTYMARGIALVTAAPTSMVNGACAFVYE